MHMITENVTDQKTGNKMKQKRRVIGIVAPSVVGIPNPPL